MKPYWIHTTYLAKLVSASNCTGEDTAQNQHETAYPSTHLEQHCPVLLRVGGLNMTGCTCMSSAWLYFQVCIMNPSLHNCSDAAAPGAKLLLLIKARVL